MELAQPWMLAVAAGTVLLAIGVGLVVVALGRRHDHAAAPVPIARAERLRTLPSFRAAVRRRGLALSGLLVLAAVSVLAAGAVAARPQTAQTIQPMNTSRDIMLCLDVSGSMTDVDIEVVEVFTELLEGFEGERIGLTIFNSSPVQIFPLTDDYDFVREHLDSLRSSFGYTDEVPEHWLGTLNGSGASLIGDGLASCAMGFDHADEQRSRSVILATDNEVAGASIITLEEASAFSAARGIRVYALNPVEGKDAGPSRQLIDAAVATGGQAYGLRETTTVADIVTEVQKQEATALRGQAQIVRTDDPDVLIVALVAAALGLVVLAWRVRL